MNYSDLDIVDRARVWASKQHADTNHLYNGGPYIVHLAMVAEVGHKYLHLVEPDRQDEALAACWAHDTIEDCRITYNDVKEVLGENVAELVYALTNEKGKNRKQRANDKYYAGIRNLPDATFVKLCDRIANWEYSINAGSRMAEMYAKENTHFLAMLFEKKYTEMAEYLVSLEKKVLQPKTT